jgi:tetratricopeptide (TPR) repeat protein
MELKEVISKIKNPEKLNSSDEIAFKKLASSYPYFQAAQSLHLKILKNENSFEFKKYLRSTALHTSNRGILFDFINRNTNEQNVAVESIKKHQDNSVEAEIFNHSTDKEEVNVSNKKRSFYDWLNLTKLKTLDQIEKNQPQQLSEKTDKNKLIDKFIEENPKISNTKEGKLKFETAIRTMPSQQMMTETLAKIYLEQKKYEKAIQAYNILILNNPKKSGFFADQIKMIQSLQENN